MTRNKQYAVNSDSVVIKQFRLTSRITVGHLWQLLIASCQQQTAMNDSISEG